MFSLFISIVLGIFAGTFTGLFPGVHINLVAAFLLAAPITFLKINPLQIAGFLIAMAITHTFLDFIPSCFLGVPEAETSLSILPAHRMLLEGRSYEAIRLTIIGSMLGLATAIFFTPIVVFFIKFIYPLIKSFIPYVILFISFLLIFKDRSKLWAFIVFLIAGVLGFAVLSSQTEQPLFPMLSGLFGISLLLTSIKNKISLPHQKITKIILDKKILAGISIKGFLSSLLCATLPGVGAAQAAYISTITTKSTLSRSYLLLIGFINTAVMFLSFIIFFSIQKTRTGIAVALSQVLQNLNAYHVFFFISVALIAASLSMILTLIIGKSISKFIAKVNYTKLCIFTACFVAIMVFYISGFLGLLVLITSTSVGLLAILKKTRKVHLMGCLVVPIVLNLIIF